MYIIELFCKIKENWGKPAPKAPKTQAQPEDEAALEEEACEHIFAPIDSTNTVLACVKCGYLIHPNPEDLKKKNIFENSGEFKI